MTPESAPQLERLLPNRAVTLFFQVFGGRLRVPPGDAVRLAERPGLHRAEWIYLSALFPLAFGGLLFDALWRLGGPWLAWVAVVPGTLLLLHGLSLIFGLGPARRQVMGWQACLLVWALCLIWTTGGEVGGVRWAIGLAFGQVALEGFGAVGALWRAWMALPGRRGIRARLGLVAGAHLLLLPLGWLGGWPAVALGCAGIAALGCGGTLIPGAQIFGRTGRRIQGRGVLLTFDDGPHPVQTPAILDLLDRYQRKAVFFVIGEKVRQYPELAREILRRGHELGNHTLTHPQGSMWCAGPARTRREIAGCSEAIEEATGVRPRWFRAPVGHRNFFTHPIAAELGMEVVAWSRRAFDTVSRDVPAMTRALTADLREGDILLLHEDTPVAVELAERVLLEVESDQ